MRRMNPGRVDLSVLSNLGVKSNIVESLREDVLERLSAIELYSVCNRRPQFPNYLDERVRRKNYGLPTARQNQAWTQRLFWGSKEVSLGDEDRWKRWLEDTIGQVLERWERRKTNLTSEYAFELLWLMVQGPPECAKIERALRSYLESTGINNEEQDDRLAQMFGYEIR